MTKMTRAEMLEIASFLAASALMARLAGKPDHEIREVTKAAQRLEQMAKETTEED